MAPATPILFSNATIISYDTAAKSLRTLRNASMLVENRRIARLSCGSDLIKLPEGTETIDATDKIISPGFIDTHHHMWQTQYRSLAPDTILFEYFARYGQTGPSHTHFTPEDVYLGQLSCALELIDCGTTTVLDHAHATFSDEHIDKAVQATTESGLRVIHAHMLDVRPEIGYPYEKSLAKFKALLNDPRFTGEDNVVELGVAYDGFAFAPAERSMQLMDVVAAHNNEAIGSGKGKPVAAITCHMVKGPYGANNSPSLLNSMPSSVITQPNLKQKVPVILSHASFLDHNDTLLLRQNQHVTISTTPESEAHYGHTSHGADMAQDCASLGVDTHFTFSSYMPFQARLWLQSLRTKWYTQTAVVRGNVPMNNPMSCKSAFLLATQKGGEALGRDDLGVIREGALADIVMFDTARPGMWGCRDPVAAVVLHSCAGDVENVMVGGRWVKKQGKPVSPLIGSGEVKAEDVRKRFEQSAKRIQSIWEELEKPVFIEGKDTGFGLANFGSCRRVEVKRQLL